MATCSHFEQADHAVKPVGKTCGECLRAGIRPVELRVCLTCGSVACCDSSSGRHATKHFQQTGHAVMRPFTRENWAWCYVHQTYLQVEASSVFSRWLRRFSSLLKQA